MEHNGELEALPVERAAAESPAREEASHEAEGDAADTQLELPQPLQDLLRRLQGTPGFSPVTQFGQINLHHKEFGHFFIEDPRECSTRTSEVRLEVLQAIGNCKTLRIFNGVSRLQNWRLSATELEVLLIPLQTSAQLEEIHTILSEREITENLMSFDWKHFISKRSHFKVVPRIRDHDKGTLSYEVASALGYPRARGMLTGVSPFLAPPTVHVDTAMIIEHTAKIISCAPKLQKLLLDSRYLNRLRCQDARGALVTALKQVPRLKELRCWLDKVTIDFLAEVYNGTSSDTVLEHLSLEGVISHGGARAEALTALVTGNITSIELLDGEDLSEVFEHGFRSDEWRNLGTSILHAPRLRKLILEVTKIGYDLELENALVQLWNACQESSRLRVTVSLYEPLSSHECLFLQRALSYSFLKSIYLREIPDIQSFAEKLGSFAENSSVEALVLEECKSSSTDGWTKLFFHLRKNTSISVLGLDWCEGLDEDNFRDLMDLLQVNFILEKITCRHTNWEAEGKGALIQEALERNKKLWGYFSVLKQANLPFNVAKAGRVFLCGDPFPGKTTLKVTMKKTVNRKSMSESVIDFAKSLFRRTKGIEVELLCEDAEATISVWDLGGQEVFRALQNILFPRSGQACIFVLAFNPFQSDCGRNNGMLKRNVQEAFQGELRSWLRFIVSNTQITGRIPPQVLVVITHKDCHNPGESFQIMSEFTKIVEALREKFQDVVDLCPTMNNSNHLFHVNAKVEEAVEPITKSVLCCMKDLLRGKSSQVPTVCSELASHFMSLPKKVEGSKFPLWKIAKFYEYICTPTSTRPSLQEFKGYRTDDANMRVLHAVASYMHDVDAVCLAPSALLLSRDGTGAFDIDSPTKLMVVQPNWLSQNLLGELISSESVGGKDRSKINKFKDHSQRASNTDGFIDIRPLNELIRKFLPKKNTNLEEEVEMVKNLLIELDLCHEIKSGDGVTKYFMPIILQEMEDNRSEGKRMNKLEWPTREDNGTSKYFGFRVQCRDQERTSLSAAFYPRYQIHLGKKMRDEFGVTDGNFLFSRHHVDIRVNGFFIFVEIDESTTNHIDIMVKYCSENMTREWAMDYIQKHTVQDLIAFCASDNGCPGVQLVLAVLRTECVKRLTPRTLRNKDQAVLIQELKERFQADVEDRFRSGTREMKEELLFGYEHTWPEIKSTSAAGQFSLSVEFELAKTLLLSKDVDDVRMAVKKNHDDLPEDLQTLLQVSSRLMQHAPSNILEWGQTLGEESTSRELDIKSQFDPKLHLPNPQLSDGEKVILQQMFDLEARLTARVVEGFQQVRSDLRNLMTNLADMREYMPVLTSKLDRIMGYTKSKEDHVHPRRPYFTLNDVGMKEKLQASTLFFGKAVRLHFMCEARHRGSPHFVKNQAGLQLWLVKDDPFSKSMRTMSMVSLKAIWILLKCGAQFAVGAGSAIPDISDLARAVFLSVGSAAGVVLDHLPGLNENISPVEDHMSIEAAWCHLREYVISQRNDYARLLNLHLVKYKDCADPYAWLCESCVSHGRKNFYLEPEIETVSYVAVG